MFILPSAQTDKPLTGLVVKPAPLGIIGVCALDVKARSKPSRNILNRLLANREFDVKIFGDKVILDEGVLHKLLLQVRVTNQRVCRY